MAQNYKFPQRIKTKVTKKLQKVTFLIEFHLSYVQKSVDLQKKWFITYKKWLNSDSIRIKFVYLQQK